MGDIIDTLFDPGATDPAYAAVAFRALLFQLLWTIEAFNRYGLRHNDLHPGNVFASSYDKWGVFQLPEGGVTFYVPRGSMRPYIYDFDRSVWTAKGAVPQENAWVSGESYLCRSYGSCSDPNPYYDAYRVLEGVEADMDAKGLLSDDDEELDWIPLREFLGRVAAPELRQEMLLVGSGRGEDAQKAINNSVFLRSGGGGDYVPLPGEMLDVTQMLMDPYFAPLRDPSSVKGVRLAMRSVADEPYVMPMSA